jgi:hypothetical protein
LDRPIAWSSRARNWSVAAVSCPKARPTESGARSNSAIQPLDGAQQRGEDPYRR